MNETTQQNSTPAKTGKISTSLAWGVVEERLARIDEGTEAAFNLAPEGPDGGPIRFVMRALEESVSRLKAELQMARDSVVGEKQ